MTQIAGRTAVVTGAASGIGRALAYGLAVEGCALALVDIDETGLAETAAGCSGASAISTHVLNVADRTAMQQLVDDVIATHGGVSLLFNNAGVTVVGFFDDLSLDDLEWNLDINLRGVLYGCKLFLPHLLAAESAHIVNISSVFGIAGVPMQSSYCASKFAVRGLSEALWEEFEGSHLRVTVVHPGGIATNIIQGSRIEDEALRNRLSRMFTKMLSPDLAARAILDGVARDRRRVLIGTEATVIDLVRRVIPALGNRWLTALFQGRDGKRRRASKLAEWASLRRP